MNRASNDIFEATSFLNATNAAYVEQMYAAWLANPNSVDEGWQTYFAQTGDQGATPTQLGRGPAWKRDSRPDFASSDLIAALTGQDPPAVPGKPGAKAKPATAPAAAPAATRIAAHSPRPTFATTAFLPILADDDAMGPILHARRGG